MYTVPIQSPAFRHAPYAHKELLHRLNRSAIAAGRDAPVRAAQGQVTTVRLSLHCSCLSVINTPLSSHYIEPQHKVKGNEMSELDLDEIYNFTIKLARDVSTITVPHLPPPTFPIYR